MSTLIGSRMKENYENVTRHFLVKRMPVIIRVDGKSFHTLTRKCKKPFDEIFRLSMEYTAQKLCEEIQNVKLAYCQSDEISLLLVDYENLNTDQWFNGNIQKIVSVSASIAGVEFTKKWGKEGYFDSRVFNVPKEEVCNYFIWRQKDTLRNSIQMVGHANFSHKSLQNLSCDEIQEKLFQEKGINWSKIKTENKRGYCIIKNERSGWISDVEIPDFTKNREYIENLI